MKKSNLGKELVLLLATTLLTMASWVGFEIYRAYTNTDLPPGVEQHLESFDPILKTEVLSTLEQMTP
ncbi:MAG: hypothetical protein UX87_C0015G0002 [Candidatus Amesbacteria bacterium GW2011_GWA1_47_16]|uniref:Uncharacterized protein n=5 Tax=Candidatus Amesiibacteriota TaxID=1752730 RepID=A0A1F4ZT78_9BACT|nr:MAG: hypothetical protein UX87_C0015G0002 [Candidatus Amesbacteria bacterium GW2011_GWA1_47_16]KKU65061.1 MAG: hypothetical protein UX86_C0002G0027 [Candidatus Amesbacteria bacterium GW2011_GWC1_47_15]KKU97300.1 MAG: hypothetical protein UY28_C0025G0002 [Candidatus Amesbacteria bacterium GW2011_GWB1_48_13]OGD00525.1 MAG: hypothetical protein A2701_01560 [Candidatus Amesbacteria bacterium RIFCSPHIGHO2_01_FULL_47_34]OGD01917.1 MAG: hypothetical protein A2972_02190 [Candidatus Amesbacteria bact